MPRKLPSASQLHRALACPASLYLPRVESLGGEATQIGTEVHRFCEVARERGRDVALAEKLSEDARAICEDLDLAAIPPGAAEVAFAYDPRTGTARELGRGIGRDYSGRREGEYVGTADLVALTDDEVIAEDLKTGRSRRAHPSRNAQLRGLGLFAARAYGRIRATIRLRYVGEEGRVYVEEATLDAFDLDDIAQELDTLADRAQQDPSELPPREGEHCKWCPCVAACPAKKTLALALGGQPESVAVLTPETAGLVWERIKLARAVLDRAEEAVQLMARQSPVPLPSGAQLVLQERTRESIDGTVARAALASELGPLFAETACEWSTSKAAIKRAAAKDKALEARALEAIRKAGGVKASTFAVVTERQP